MELTLSRLTEKTPDERKMKKPRDLINRDAEWKTLADLYESNRPELAFLLGRRRVGKSYLLARFARETKGIYYQATRRTASEQLAGLSMIVGDHFDDPALRNGVVFASWENLFSYLADRVTSLSADNTPLVVILDEFPYLVDALPALPSVLQSAWDHLWQDLPFKLILSGSYISAMRRLDQSDQPLYGRRTRRLLLGPFAPGFIQSFVPDYSPFDLLRTFGVFGNLPGNLTLLDRTKTFEENGTDLLLDPSGRLLEDAQTLLDPFLNDATVHYSILGAIAAGEQTWGRITSRIGRSGGALLRPMQWLEEMGLIERVVPITEKNRARAKKVLYRMTDPYLIFWHRIVAPLLRSGSLGIASGRTLWRKKVEPQLDNHMGTVFEMACREFVRHTDALPFEPLRVGAWWEGEEEVDLVVTGLEGELLIGECKWGSLTTAHIHTLERRALLVAERLGHDQEIVTALFTGREKVSATTRREADQKGIRIFTAGDIVR